ncbi:alpha/beta hydrolase [Bacillus altitudinis]|uniref:alpha/beta hydrolase n=1 Tax=Bacillus altitudinis TaxID=293387 RepID=UPI0011A8F3A4|nr:alpha/beta hydrolase [Bacillus altitudinis]
MRSIQSLFVEWLLVLTKKKLNVEGYLEERRMANQLPYVLPEKLKKKYHITKSSAFSVATYMLKSDVQPDDHQVLFLHGGGYIEQPLVWHWRFLDRLTKQLNSTVYVPVYPKAPNHQYMDAIESVLPVYQALLEKGTPEKIVIMGDSAGGGLSLAFAQYLAKKGLPQPGNLILLSPWLDVTLSHPDIAKMVPKEPMLNLDLLIESGKAYAGDTDETHHLISPIYGEIKSLGRISVFIGTHEFFLPDARKFKEMADKQGVPINYIEYPKMNHVFPVFPIPEANQALKQIVAIIESKTFPLRDMTK